MAFSLPDLPYAKDALEPHISAETLEYHYGKHHQTYVDKLNGMIENTDHARQVASKTSSDRLTAGCSTNAAQVWNPHILLALPVTDRWWPAHWQTGRSDCARFRQLRRFQNPSSLKPPSPPSVPAGPGWSRPPTAKFGNHLDQQRPDAADRIGQTADDLRCVGNTPTTSITAMRDRSTWKRSGTWSTGITSARN